jgi:hypothetical protein
MKIIGGSSEAITTLDFICYKQGCSYGAKGYLKAENTFTALRRLITIATMHRPICKIRFELLA